MSNKPTQKVQFDEIWDQIPNRKQLQETALDATIRSPGTIPQRTRKTLPTVQLTKESSGGLFRLEGELGRGGMGIVHNARQAPMDREVAVKVPRDADDPTCVRDLMREAHVMGYLEHPNIVPVHVLGQDDAGGPFVVMKRIEGTTLTSRIADGKGLESLDDVLEVLETVCHALEYAHDRGVIHRDIKPSNIMIGAFGEVYLMDWGTAAAFRDDVPDIIPRPDPTRVVGTPIYLAPEMVVRPRSVGPSTDVYLMGGVLYATLTGRAPHAGATHRDVLQRAFDAAIEPLGDEVPPELASICRRALARDPEARFQTVAEFREALSSFQEHHAADRLLRAARERSAELDELLEQEAPESSRVYRVFGEARQSYEEAQGIWPEDPRPAIGLQDLIGRVVEYELAHGDGAAASRLLVELPEPDEELEARCARALKQQEAEAEELETLRRAVDPTHEARVQATFLFAIGLAIGLFQLVPPLALGFEPTATFMMGSHLGLIAIMSGVSVLYRERLFATLANRTIASGAWLLVLFGFLLRLGVLMGRGSLSHALFLDLGLVSLICGYVGISVDRRVLAIAPAYAAFAVAAALWPSQAVFIFAASHTVNLMFLAAVYYVSSGSEG